MLICFGAIDYPRCINVDPEENSDCGSAGWAFTLFIAWNLLSMVGDVPDSNSPPTLSQYIFVNMFTGVITENFSHMFQTSGDTKALTRAQMRPLKKLWADLENPRTWHLEHSCLCPSSELSGVFEERIYPAEFSIPNIQATCKPSNDSQYAWPGGAVDGIDLNKLKKLLNNIGYAAIWKRGALYI
ncbi:hypothetical protein B0H14DRAFT_3427384 [Mycena olivaceomarginata]|nr:hypothetical protein B0H14DRAFT_3427384 [Mycena olivaceomarginata]